MTKQLLLLQDKILENLSPEPLFIAKDHTVSNEEFRIRYNEDYDMMVTYPHPEISRLGEYYRSDEYISHTDSRKTFFDKIYQKVKVHMLNKKLQWIEDDKKEKGRMLDIGAGTGDFLAAAEKRGWKVSGIEPNPEARKLAEGKGVFLNENSRGLESGSFDVITLWHVLEHVPGLESQIIELHRLLKTDGLLIVAVPNFKSYDAYKYREHWAAFDVPRHLWHFSQKSIDIIFSEFNFEVQRSEPLKFDSYYVSLLSEKYKSGKRNIIKGGINGYISNMVAKRTGEYSSLAYFLRKSFKS